VSKYRKVNLKSQAIHGLKIQIFHSGANFCVSVPEFYRIYILLQRLRLFISLFKVCMLTKRASYALPKIPRIQKSHCRLFQQHKFFYFTKTHDLKPIGISAACQTCGIELDYVTSGSLKFVNQYFDLSPNHVINLQRHMGR